MGRLAWLAPCLLALVACGGPSVTAGDAQPSDGTTTDAGPDPNDGAHSGTRLKIVNWVFPDGTRQWDTFYDSQRKENCYLYGPWPDGNIYCTPNGASVVYSDAGCTTRVAQVYRDPNCAQAPPMYALDWNYTPCTSTPSHLYVRGGKLTLTAYYFKGSDGTCGGPYTSTNEDYYSLSAEVTTTDLVKLSVGSPVGASRLNERFVTSSDGLQFPWTVHDSMLGDDCYTTYYGDGAPTASCAPSSSWYAAYAHDAACTVTELSINRTCGAPKYANTYPYNACPTDPEQYYTVGPALAGSPLYYPSGGMCYATTADPSQSYYGVAQPLTLATLTRTPDAVAGHRMQLVHMTTPDGLRWRDYSIYDTQKAAECYPFTLPDGTTRCITWGNYSQQFFSNSTCTTPIDLVQLSTGPSSCGAPPVSKFASKYVPPPAGTCAYSYEVHIMGAQYTGPVYTNYGTCTRYLPTQTEFYALGAVVPLTDFASASTITDQ